MIKTVPLWETRPLQCWDKAKEVRRKYEKARVEAAQESKLLIDGMDASIFAALGDLQSTMVNPLGAMIANRSTPFSRECLTASECKGFGREVCGYHREVFGSMHLNRDIEGGPFPRRDISIPTPAPCDQHSKRGQPISDFFGIPRFQGEAPIYTGELDPARETMMLEHRADEIEDEIAWLEKATGHTFDDEVFRENVLSTMRLHALAGEVFCMNQNIPAPIDQKSIYSFFTLGGLVRGDQAATEEIWKELRDEVKSRVANRIAAVGTERYRWVESMPPPWFFLKYYRYMEKYGAVCIGSAYSHVLGGPYVVHEDGSYGPNKTPLELGWPMRTRRDVIRANIYAFIRPGHFDDLLDTWFGGRGMLNLAKYFKCQGALLPLWRSGVGCTFGHKEYGDMLAATGVRVNYYEGCQPGDRTDFDDNRMLDQLDNWMESQGLSKLED